MNWVFFVRVEKAPKIKGEEKTTRGSKLCANMMLYVLLHILQNFIFLLLAMGCWSPCFSGGVEPLIHP